MNQPVRNGIVVDGATLLRFLNDVGRIAMRRCCSVGRQRPARWRCRRRRWRRLKRCRSRLRDNLWLWTAFVSGEFGGAQEQVPQGFDAADPPFGRSALLHAPVLTLFLVACFFFFFKFDLMNLFVLFKFIYFISIYLFYFISIYLFYFNLFILF